MFIVTGLYSKRRPIGINKSYMTIGKRRVEKPSLLPRSRGHTNRFSSLSSARLSQLRMSRNTLNRDEKDKHPPLKFALGRPAPARVRKFIPKPLILVEKMKARQHLPEASSTVISELTVSPESLNRSMTAITTPPATHVTPTPQRMQTCGVHLSGSQSSSSVSFRISSWKDVAFRNGFGMMPRLVRPLSVVTLGDSPSSTDTFVGDSPCCIKQASKAPLSVTEIDATNAHENVESAPKVKSVSDTSVSLLIDSVAGDFMHQTGQSIDMFEPTMTSTPFVFTQINTNDVPSPTTSIASSAYPTYPSRPTRMPGLSDSFEIVSPTSRVMYPFNAPKGAYIVKLPNATSTNSLSDEVRLASTSTTTTSYSEFIKPRAPLSMLSNAPGLEPSRDFKRISNRVTSPCPTLVLDGVFALPGAPPPSTSSRWQTHNHFLRLHKPSPCRLPLPPPSTPSNTFTLGPDVNALVIAPRSPSPRLRGQPSPESPRSKLAHVLTAHVRPQTTTMTSLSMSMSMSMARVYQKGKGRVPPLVKGVQASNDPRTQCEIEGLRMRRVVGYQVCREGGDGGSGSGREYGGGDDKEAIERMSLASVGIVSKLRARWEKGEGI